MTNSGSEQQLDDRVQRWAIGFMQISLAAAMVYGIATAHWEIFFMSTLALILSGLPLFLRSTYNLRLPVEYDFVIVLFIYASIFLGEVGDAYEKFWWWDVLLHISSGLVLGFVGFLLFYSLYGRNKVTASPLVLACFVFCFGLACGALWEIFEFVMDSIFGLNMQKNGLRDTMFDLIVDAAGSLVVARTAHQYITHNSPVIFRRSIRLFLEQNPWIVRRWRRSRS
jgi:hypothetical protein